MTLQRQVLTWLLVITSVIWIVAVAGGAVHASLEIEELFDTEQVRMAQQALRSHRDVIDDSPSRPTTNAAHSTSNNDAGDRTAADSSDIAARASDAPVAATGTVDTDSAEPEDVAMAIWNSQGTLLSRADDGQSIPFSSEASGFRRQTIASETWKVYYLNEPEIDRIVAVAFRLDERISVARDLILSQLAPFVVSLPLLLITITIAVRRAFQPLRDLARNVEARTPDNLLPIALEHTPGDIKPLAIAMNRLFDRVSATLAHERRLTADASHELRTPIAALQAQWDALTLANTDAVRERAIERMGQGIDRLGRLTSQLLNLSSIDAESSAHVPRPVHWQGVVESAINDVLPLLEKRQADINVEWQDGEPGKGLALLGDDALLTMLVRNLLDNSLRYSPTGVAITLRFAESDLQCIDNGPGLPDEVLTQLGSRFYRPEGSNGHGSGIGISIVMRIAQIHDLAIRFDTLEAQLNEGDAAGASDAQGAKTRATGLRVTLYKPGGAGNGQ